MEKKNEALPQDVQNEILLRLPVKSLGKCICVSKKWAALIREKNFRDLYFRRSMTRPRLLFKFSRRDDPTMVFHSFCQENEPFLSSCQQQTRITLEPESAVCAVLQGLVCIRSTFKIMLCNPVIKQFLALPELRERDRDREVVFVKAYLGYDEATEVFKVLCLTNKRFDNKSVDYRVFTVGSGEECWRTIIYELQHTPLTKGLCKDGVLYYGALSITNDPIVISFNLGSEELNVIELPHWKLNPFCSSLVNYKGEIALSNTFVASNGEIRVLVRNEVAGDWREERIVIPRWRDTVGDLCINFCFKGTIGTGEFVFALDMYNLEGSMFVLYYDTITQLLTKFEIDGVDSNFYASTFLNHVDSLLLM